MRAARAVAIALSAIIVARAAIHADEPAQPLAVRAVVFSPDGKLLAAGYADKPPGKGRVTVWDAATRQVRWTQERPDRVYTLSFSPDGKTLAVGSSGPEAKLLDAGNGQVQATLPAVGKSDWKVEFAPDGKAVVVGSYEGHIKVWDVATRAEVKSLVAHTGRFYHCGYSRDGRLLVSAGDGAVKLWDLASGEEKHVWTHERSVCQSAVFSADGRWVLYGLWDGTIRLRSTETGEQRCKFGNVGGVHGLALHPASNSLAICTNGRAIQLRELNLHEPTKGEAEGIEALLNKLDDDSYEVREAASADFQKLGFLAEAQLRRAATESGSAEVRIRARRLRQELLTRPWATLDGHAGSVECVAFSADGKLLASGSKDGTVRVWDVAGRRELACLRSR